MTGKNVHDDKDVGPSYMLIFVNKVHDNIGVCPLCVHDYKKKRTW